MDKGKTYVKNSPVLINASSILYEGGGRTLADLLDLVYPIGSIYMNTNNVNPQSIFGGVWQKIEGRFLLGSSGGYTLGSLGGEATHTLTVSEMPKHKPSILLNTQDSYTTGSAANWQIVTNGRYYAGDMFLEIGGNQPHNNMPPYLVVNIWKRTA